MNQELKPYFMSFRVQESHNAAIAATMVLPSSIFPSKTIERISSGSKARISII